VSAARPGRRRPGSTLHLLGLHPPGISLRSLTHLRACALRAARSRHAFQGHSAIVFVPPRRPEPLHGFAIERPSLWPSPAPRRRSAGDLPVDSSFRPVETVCPELSSTSTPVEPRRSPRFFSPPFLQRWSRTTWKAVKATLRVGLWPSLDGHHCRPSPARQKGGHEVPTPEQDLR
jgi:hypothetical protein